MRGGSSVVTYLRGLLVFFLVVGATASVVAVTTTSASYSVYNGGWNGTSELGEVADRTNVQSTVVFDAEEYSEVEPDETLAVVLSSKEGVSSTERREIRAFVRAGGTLLIAGDFGAERNRLLAAVGADARFAGQPLRDPVHNADAPALAVATNGTDTSVSSTETSLVLNYGTAVRPNGATVGVTTSEYAYLDRNNSRTLDGNETMRSYPVVTVERVGEGRVIAVGDPSIFINMMLDYPANRAFVRNLFEQYSTVLLDYSHVETPLFVVVWKTVLNTPLLQALFGLVGVAGFGLWAYFGSFTDGLPQLGRR